MRRILTIIPARGGSKGIPRKNIQMINDRHLIGLAIEKARASKLIDRIIVSTDDEEFARIARGYGVEVPFLRPAELANDRATLLEVCWHALDYFDQTGERFDAILSLQATTPLLKTETINRAISLFHDQNADCVVTISEIRHGHPLIAKKLRDGAVLVDYVDKPGIPKYPRQAREKAYYPNGGLFLRDRKLLEELDQATNGLGPSPLGVLTTPEESINIDDPFDLKIARALMTSSVQEKNEA